MKFYADYTPYISKSLNTFTVLEVMGADKSYINKINNIKIPIFNEGDDALIFIKTFEHIMGDASNKDKAPHFITSIHRNAQATFKRALKEK